MMFQINRLAVIRIFALLFHHFHLIHTVDSVMNNAGMFPVISNQIVIIVIEYSCKRIYEITFVVFTIYALMLFIEIKILERNLFIILYRRIYFAYSIKDILVRAFSRVKPHDIALQKFGAMTSAEIGNLIKQNFRFTRRNKARRLHRIHKNTQFGNVETSVRDTIAIRLSRGLFTKNLVAEIVQHLYILI